ncbi:MAG: hypothetical protein MRY59_00870 [Aquisalinus sp.]|nr:hypothetical protein [Aquisalinus sp.]
MKYACALVTAGVMLAAAPTASAQIGIDLGGNIELDTDVEVRVGEPYEYRRKRNGEWYTYRSDRWYPYTEPRRERVYDRRYGGYDCYRAFQYTWYRDEQVRYDSYWCYDDAGRAYEVRETRVVVRVN